MAELGSLENHGTNVNNRILSEKGLSEISLKHCDLIHFMGGCLSGKESQENRKVTNVVIFRRF